MQQDVRRKDRQLTDRDEMLRILDAAEYGFLSLVDEDGAPYGVPMNFVRQDRRLIFHCAPDGRKFRCLRFRPRVSFCVVGRTNLLPAQFTTEYESVIVVGEAEIVDDDARKIEDLMILCRKLSPEHLDDAENYIRKSLHRTGVFELRIESMTGKAKRPKAGEAGPQPSFRSS